MPDRPGVRDFDIAGQGHTNDAKKSPLICGFYRKILIN